MQRSLASGLQAEPTGKWLYRWRKPESAIPATGDDRRLHWRRQSGAVCRHLVEKLDLEQLGFERAVAAETGRPGYDPGDLLPLYLYGYLNRIRSSRRLEREAGRNLELMWLLRRLRPEFKTIADFRRDNGRAIQQVCESSRWSARI